MRPVREALAALVAGLAYLAALIPAHAQDVASFSGTGCILIPVDESGIIARLECLNVETTGDAFSEGAMTAGGLTVGLTVSHGPGAVQDEFTSGSAVVVEWLGY